MARPLISRAVLTELREYFVYNHVLRSIRDAFEDQGVHAQSESVANVSGERRQLVEEYYAGLDLTNVTDVQKLLRVIEREIARCQPDSDQVSQSAIGTVVIALEQEGYRVDGYRVLLAQSTPLAHLRDHLEAIDSQSVLDDWDRMLRTAETDPEDAITSARALIESTCKSILDDLQVHYEHKWNLSKLYKTTANSLRLSPEGHSEQVFKQILGSLFGVSAGLGEVRNAFGDAHGKGKRPVRAAPRHAKLAVNAAGTLAVFLLETHEAIASASARETADPQPKEA